jgi:heptosyltransferase-2
MHLGAILATRGIVPFGPTDFTDTGPVTPYWRIISDRVACAPCLKHSCPLQNRICMQGLTASRMIRELYAMVREFHLPFRKEKKKY